MAALAATAAMQTKDATCHSGRAIDRLGLSKSLLCPGGKPFLGGPYLSGRERSPEVFFPFRPLVAVLLGLGCPAAIFRRVVALVVDPIDAVLRRRLRSHVGQERLERPPAFADLDASTAIVLE